MQNQISSAQCQLWDQPSIKYKNINYELTCQIQPFRLIQFYKKILPSQSDYLQLSLSFQKYDELENFNKKFQQAQIMFNQGAIDEQNNNIDDAFYSLIKQSKLKIRKSQLKQYKDFRIQFNNQVQLISFFRHFKNRLSFMQTQYNYFIMPRNKFMVIYIKDHHQTMLNSFFLNQISDMKKVFKFLLTVSNEGLFDKLKYSKIAEEKINQKKISYLLLHRQKRVAFYTQNYQNKYQIQNVVQKTLIYHIIIIKFPNKYIQKHLLQQIFKLISRQLRPLICELQKMDQHIKIQFNLQKCAIVINDIHQIFDESYLQIRSNLHEIKVIQFTGQFLKQMKDLIKKKKYQKFLKIQIKYRFFFIIFNKKQINNISNNKSINEFLKDFSQFFASKYQMVIYIMQNLIQIQKNYSKQYLQNQKKKNQQQKYESKRIIQLCEKYQLYCSDYHMIQNKNYPKLIIQPKDYCIYSSTSRSEQNIKQFLHDYLYDVKLQQNKNIIQIKKYQQQNKFINKYCENQNDKSNQAKKGKQNSLVNKQNNNYKVYNNINSQDNFLNQKNKHIELDIEDYSIQKILNNQKYLLNVSTQHNQNQFYSIINNSYSKIQDKKKYSKCNNQLSAYNFRKLTQIVPFVYCQKFKLTEQQQQQCFTEEGLFYRTKKRFFKLQDEIRKIYKIKLKIYKIALNQQVRIPQIDYFKTIQFLSNIFTKQYNSHYEKTQQSNQSKQFTYSLSLKQYQYLNKVSFLHRLEKQNQMFLCYVNQQKHIYVPCYFVIAL